MKKKGSLSFLNKEVEDYILFAKGIAKKTYKAVILNLIYRNSNLFKFEPLFTLGDCEQAAYIGLEDAYQRYDPTKWGSFKNFAYKRIRGEILDQMIKSLPVPRTILKTMKKNGKDVPKIYDLEGILKEDRSFELKETIKSEIDSCFNGVDTVDEIFFLLKGFSENERKIFIYRDLQKYTLEQAVKRIGISKNTAWFAHPKIRERLRSKIKERALSF